MKTSRIGSSWIHIVLVAATAVAAGCDSTSGGGADGAARQASARAGEDGGEGDPLPEGDGALSAPCSSHAVGDGTCAGVDVLKDLALETCGTAGRTMAELQFPFDCGDRLSTVADVVCCEPGASPDAGKSLFGLLGDGVTCVEDATYLDLANAACAEADLVLHDLATTTDCGPDASRSAKYICLE